MTKEEEISKIRDDIVKVFTNRDGSIFKKFKIARLDALVKGGDVDGIKEFLEQKKKKYEALSASCIRKANKKNEEFAAYLKKEISRIKQEKKEEIEKLIERLDELKKQNCVI